MIPGGEVCCVRGLDDSEHIILGFFRGMVFAGFVTLDTAGKAHLERGGLLVLTTHQEIDVAPERLERLRLDA